jgi:chemotaxis protein CheX
VDVKLINPFIDAIADIMPQLGFQKVEKVGLEVIGSHVANLGVMSLVGVMGAVKGNVIYNIESEVAKKIASTMMMGMPVQELDAMAQSAISELANMLCANASIKLANIGISTDISPPTLLFGDDVSIKVATDKVLAIRMMVDGLPLNVNIAIE